MIDISIVVPGIRTENWTNLYKSIYKAIKNYNIEVIFVGPYDPPQELVDKVIYIKDLGCPSRALQLGFIHSSGKLVMWAVDDGIFVEDSLDLQIEKFLSFGENSKKILNLIYTEGPSWKFGGDDRINQPYNWYRGKWHDDFRGLDGINDSWISTILFIMYTKDLIDLGGIDCRFETINFNLHDLSYRAIKEGYDIYFGDTNKPFQRIDWQQGNLRPKDEPIFAATFENDKPLFQSIYQTKESASKRPNKIALDNWKQSPEKWVRKWAQEHTA